MEQIRQGDYALGEKLPSEPDIAKHFGVSRMTANKSILALVSAGWLIRERGRGTFVARGATLASPHTYHAVVPVDVEFALEDIYFGPLYWTVHRLVSEESGRLDLIRIDSDSDGMSLPGYGRYVFLNPAESAVPAIVRAVGSGSTVVVLGASWSIPGAAIVDSDNLLGATLATKHLVDLGHRRILFLGTLGDNSNSMDRLRGFRVTMASHRLAEEAQRPLIVREAIGMDTLELSELGERLSGPQAPTAIFAAGSKIAFQAIGLLTTMGLRCPEDVSVVAYDDPDFFQLAHPSITTIRQPLIEMAEVAARILLDPSSDAGSRRLYLEPDLIVRGTTAPFRYPMEEQ